MDTSKNKLRIVLVILLVIIVAFGLFYYLYMGRQQNGTITDGTMVENLMQWSKSRL